MRTTPFLVLAIVFAAGNSATAAPVPKHLVKEAENTEQAKLQGKWKVESIVVGGANVGAAGVAGQEITFEIAGDQLRVVTREQTVTSKFKLETADGLKVFTTVGAQKAGVNGNPPAREDDVTAGYAIDGDTLRLAMKMPAGGGKVTTPADPAKPGNNDIVLVLSRVKDKK